VVGECGRWAVGAAAVVEEGAVGRVGEQPAPGAGGVDDVGERPAAPLRVQAGAGATSSAANPPKGRLGTPVWTQGGGACGCADLDAVQEGDDLRAAFRHRRRGFVAAVRDVDAVQEFDDECRRNNSGRNAAGVGDTDAGVRENALTRIHE
jgi:hypothetical protein